MEQFGTWIAKCLRMAGRDQERQDWIADQLRANNLDAFVCATPANVLMLSGYWPVIGKSIAIASRNGDLHLIVPQDEQELASGNGAQVTTYSGSLNKITTVNEDVALPLSSTLSQLGLTNARLGVETGPLLIPAAYVSVHVFGKDLSTIIMHCAGNAALVAADNDLAYLRSRLTKADVQKLHIACEIAAIAYKNGRSSIQEGATEAEVAAAYRVHLSTNVGYKNSQRTDGAVWCMSGPNSANAYAAFQRSTQRPLQSGDLVLMHCNSYADGYWTDITRTYTVGNPSERKQKIFDAIEEARKTAIAAVRPGVQAKEVDAASREVMAAHGFGHAFRHGTGHGVGFAAIDHDASPRLSPHSPDTIEDGMAFNVEPGAYFEGYGGARHCDMVLCTGNGPELLTDF